MKKLIIGFLAFAMLFSAVGESFAAIKYINSYSRKDGTRVSGHYRDTSNDGNSWNNANTLGYNSY